VPLLLKQNVLSVVMEYLERHPVDVMWVVSNIAVDSGMAAAMTK
jgi:hypothetical protein